MKQRYHLFHRFTQARLWSKTNIKKSSRLNSHLKDEVLIFKQNMTDFLLSLGPFSIYISKFSPAFIISVSIYHFNCSDNSISSSWPVHYLVILLILCVMVIWLTINFRLLVRIVQFDEGYWALLETFNRLRKYHLKFALQIMPHSPRVRAIYEVVHVYDKPLFVSSFSLMLLQKTDNHFLLVKFTNFSHPILTTRVLQGVELKKINEIIE